MLCLKGALILKLSCSGVVADVMVGMGYKLEDIQESLTKMKYDQFTATYLLLGRKASEVGAPGSRWWNQLRNAFYRPDATVILMLCISCRCHSKDISDCM